MLPPLIQRTRRSGRPRERGITLALVALAIFSIIAMAGLSIDVGTLYQASAEAQRAADSAALAAARVLSLSGMTGDPTNLSNQWATACTAATQMAQAVAGQATVGGAAPSSVAVTFLAKDGSDCTAGSGSAVGFGVNPLVTVKVTQASLPTYFSRIWGRTGSTVSATATAEVFNPSNSGAFAAGGNIVPVQPRCVKPWIVPNRDPGNPKLCSITTCNPFINLTTANGSIQNGGILLNSGGTGVIGESFFLIADCSSSGGNCNSGPPFVSPPVVNPPNYLQYLPGQVLGFPAAVPSCGTANPYQQAIAGCDQSTPYQCGVQSSNLANPNLVDLTENPYGPAGDTATAAQCLTNQYLGSGEDSLDVSVYPYQIDAGAANPLPPPVSSGSVITSSNSIVSLPIYDDVPPLIINGSKQAPVTIVGFLQVFIQHVNADGSLVVIVMNVAACGNALTSPTPFLTGTSPVPVRLITPP
jgi:Flp pilus assembly protein TadG